MSRILQGSSGGHASPRRRARAAGLVVALAVVAAAAVGGPVPAPVEAETTPPIRVLGKLPLPPDAGTHNVAVAGFEQPARRMYLFYKDKAVDLRLAAYDMGPSIPAFVSSRDVPGVDAPYPYQVAIDIRRRRAYWANGELQGAQQKLRSVGLEGDGHIDWPFHQVVPGAVVLGLTYSAEDDRIYLVGERSGSPMLAPGPIARKVASPLPFVAALDPDDGSVLWVREIPECQQVLYSQWVGSLITRSSPELDRRGRASLLLPCATGSTTGHDTYPGVSGVLTLEITPTADMVTAQQFEVRFHPISGTYSNGSATGVAGYDVATDRLFLQSLSVGTPGAWVFDARSGGWVGFISAPGPADFFMGINPTTGHYYMGGSYSAENRFLLISDGRANPPQNGVNVGREYAPLRFVAADPDSNRFLLAQDQYSYTVVDDLTRSVPPTELVGYDALTDDMAETADTYVSFNGDTGGFGSRVVHVGGLNGAYSHLQQRPTLNEAVPMSTTTRAITSAASPAGSSVNTAGAAASAQASDIDSGTAEDLADHSQDPTAPDDPDDPGDDDDYPLVRWPHASESCLDGGEGVHNPPEETREGYAKVTCNLKGYEATATARHTAAVTTDTTIGRSSYESKVTRTVKDGVRTDTTSFVSGIHVDVPQVGTLDIGKVAVTATTLAHGRRGTAKATWTRTVDGVVVRDLTGKPLVQETGCTTVVSHDGTMRTVDDRHTSCDGIAEAVRKALQVRVKLAFPTAEVVATPKGAFAGVAQGDGDYYHEITVSEQGKIFKDDKVTRRTVPGLQLDVYNDGSERSRLVVQVAAVENSSLFYVNKSLDDPPCDTGGCIPGGDSGEFADLGGDTADVASDLGGGDIALGGLADPTVDGPAGSLSTRRGARGTGTPEAVGLVVARRGFGNGALMVSLLLLCSAAVGSVSRRRRLLGSLGRAS